jgi:hypothetical protein
MPHDSGHRFLFLDGERTRGLLAKCKDDARGDKKIHVTLDPVAGLWRVQEWSDLELREHIRSLSDEVLTRAGVTTPARAADVVPGNDGNAPARRKPRQFDPMQTPAPWNKQVLAADPLEALVLREKANAAHHSLVVTLDAHLRGWI